MWEIKVLFNFERLTHLFTHIKDVLRIINVTSWTRAGSAAACFFLFALWQIKRQRTVQSGSDSAKHHVLDGLRNRRTERTKCREWFLWSLMIHRVHPDWNKLGDVLRKIMMAADIHAPPEMLDERRPPALQNNGTNNEGKHSSATSLSRNHDPVTEDNQRTCWTKCVTVQKDSELER